jgi:hypothetical protein
MVGGIRVLPHVELNIAHLSVRVTQEILEALAQFFSPSVSVAEQRVLTGEIRIVPKSVGVLGIFNTQQQGMTYVRFLTFC